MRYLIFEHSYQGHILEYVSHQYRYAGQFLGNHTVIFILHPGIKKKWNLLNWPHFNNIKIEYIPEKQVQKIESLSRYFRSWWLCKTLQKFVNRYNPDKIIVDELISFMPFLPLIIYNNSVRGIMYRIPRHRIQTSKLKKFFDDIILRIMAKSDSIERVWLLNDLKSPDIYNAVYHTYKFKFLPDPINIERINTIRHPSLPKNFIDKKIFLHAGGMGIRKGTFTIIDTIKSIVDCGVSNCAFIFAGSLVNPLERMQMKTFIKRYELEVSIMFLDKFISYELLSGYFLLADYILIPYKNVEQSSGILGYSAYFNKPVIGPGKGLLGELIIENNLGLAIENLNSETLKDTIINLVTCPNFNGQNYNSSCYVQRNSVQRFVESIYQI